LCSHCPADIDLFKISYDICVGGSKSQSNPLPQLCPPCFQHATLIQCPPTAQVVPCLGLSASYSSFPSLGISASSMIFFSFLLCCVQVLYHWAISLALSMIFKYHLFCWLANFYIQSRLMP
jgi:hypothetical protein